MKTIKELADEFKVSKQAVRKQLTDDFRSNHVQTITSNGVDILVVDDKGYLLLNKHFNKGEQGGNYGGNVTDNTVTAINFLKNQLEIKDTQLLSKDEEIKQLHKLLENSQNLIDQEQQLHLADQKRIDQLEKPENKQPTKENHQNNQANNSNDKQQTEQPKKGLFKRLFNK